jgi:MFS transporter, AAHS family, 4-hydroxybenzoate transporter
MAQIDLSALIEESRVSRFQLRCVVICILILICENIDLQAVAYTGPSIRESLHLSPAQLGPVFSAGLTGMMCGSFLFSPLADRLGRRPVMLTSVFLFAVVTLATALAQTAPQLVAMRFIAGLGFGGAFPNGLSLAAEYLPRRNRFFLMSIIGTAFSVGGSISGFVATVLVPAYGWRAMYVASGGFALLVGLALLVLLPESLRFLAAHPTRHQEVRAIAARIAPALAADPATRFVVTEAPAHGVPILNLFRGGRAALTLSFWTGCFCILLVMYFVLNWVPVLAREAGLSTRQAILMPTLFQVGSSFGSLTMGFLMDRVGNPLRVTATCCLGAALAVAAMGTLGTNAGALMAINMLAGFFVIGAQGSINTGSSVLYPTAMRVTGVGWTLGIGRIGSLMGPLAGGALLSLGWSGADLLHAAAIPLLVASIVVFALSGRAIRAAAPAVATI